MFNLFKKKIKSQIGLDISSEGITMIVLIEENNRIFIKNYIYKSFEKEIRQNDQRADGNQDTRRSDH